MCAAEAAVGTAGLHPVPAPEFFQMAAVGPAGAEPITRQSTVVAPIRSFQVTVVLNDVASSSLTQWREPHRRVL
ncbi:MAG: hypothetical protein ACXU7D_11260, partial [Burkholderiaceae bacterium]